METFLMVFCGPEGVGKRSFTEFLATKFPERFEIASWVTTRQRRGGKEGRPREFLLEADFERAVLARQIIELGRLPEKRRGFSVQALRRALTTRHALIRLRHGDTEPLAAHAEFADRIRVVILQPRDRDVISENMRARTDSPTQIANALFAARHHVEPTKHHALLIMCGLASNFAKLAADLFRQLGI